MFSRCDQLWADGAETVTNTNRTNITYNGLGQNSAWQEDGRATTLQDGVVLTDFLVDTLWQGTYAINGRSNSYVKSERSIAVGSFRRDGNHAMEREQF